MLTDLFQGLLDELNYLNVTILMAVESSAIPFPSEIVVPPAAYMAAEKGEMSIPLVIVFATLGSCIGAAINYVVSYYVGRPIVYKFVNSRLGHICLLNQEKMERAEAYFDSKGAIATLIGRLIPGIRQLIPCRSREDEFWIFFTLYSHRCRSVEHCLSRTGLVSAKTCAV